MSPWAEVLGRIQARDADGTARLVAQLDAGGRGQIAAELPGYLQQLRRGRREGPRDLTAEAPALRVAGAACLTGAAQVAGWLSHRDLQVWRSLDDPDRIVAALRHRPEPWRADLARRLVQRLRPLAQTWQRYSTPSTWRIAATLVAETGITPPENDAFVSRWVDHAPDRWDHVERLRADPLLDHMVPRLFEADGAPEALAYHLRHNGECNLVTGLVALAAEGRLPRPMLLDGCVSRFLTGGAAGNLLPYARLYRDLRPTVEEVPARDFARVLPTAPTPVADLAYELLRRVDDAGRLDDDLFAEAVAALAFRPEKKLATAGLRWISDVVRRLPRRAEAGLAAVAIALAQDALPLRERAARLALTLAPLASEQGRTAVRAAATGLPADLRERLAAKFGDIAPEDDAPPPTPVAIVDDRTLPPPIVSIEDLAREITHPRWPGAPDECERLLAALVMLTHRNLPAVRDALDAVDARSFRYGISASDMHPYTYLRRAALAIVAPQDSRKLTDGFVRRGYAEDQAAPDLIVQLRLREIVAMLENGRTLPVLLATPTEPTGHIDPMTLIERMQSLEQAGAEPLDADFQQALLRLPRATAREAVVRAATLRTPAGRMLACWLERGGLPDPAVTWAEDGGYGVRIEPAQAGLPGLIERLCTLGRDELDRWAPCSPVWWPQVMPSHREVIAAWTQCTWRSTSGKWRAATLSVLVHAHGPAGASTATALARALGEADPVSRDRGVDALLLLAAQGELPAAELGQTAARMAKSGDLKLNRFAAALDQAVAAGAHAKVWETIAATLRLLLAARQDKPHAGLADLIAVGTKAAFRARARTELPEIAVLAERGGTSRSAREARRLRDLIGSFS
ncbi:UNVERIFIED_ORG: hypothetical protein FHR35_001337 [Microbispora rosea subsp. rosea]